MRYVHVPDIFVMFDIKYQYSNNNNTRTQVLNAINRRERAQRTSRRREKQKRIVEAKFTIDLSRLHHRKITLGKDRDGREYNLMTGDTSTVFVCETNEDKKSWAYFDAKKHLSELLKWFDPKKYESEALLTRRVRMLKDAHENNLVPSNSETMSNLSDMISIGLNHEIETLIPKTLTCFKPSELSCKFCGYQAREGERHCRSCHTTFLVNPKNKSSVKKFLDHEQRCAKKKIHKHIASMDTESLNRLGVVKCAIGKMELALTYLNALTDKNQDSQRVAWHEYLKRAISPEMAMEVRTFSVHLTYFTQQQQHTESLECSIASQRCVVG